MTPLLLHGPAIKASRIKLLELRKKFNPANVVVFEKGEDLGTILTNLQSTALFEGDRLVIVENPQDDLQSLPPKEGRTIFDANSLMLILWFDHEIDTKKWPGFKCLFFPEGREVSVFPFLDCLAVKDKKAYLEMDKLKAAGFDVHYFFTMVFYLLRSLLVTPKNASQFVRNKLDRQRKYFTQGRITDLYKSVLEIEFKVKSGLLEKPQAEFLLIFKFLGH